MIIIAFNNMNVLSGLYQFLQLSSLENMIESLPLFDTPFLLILCLPRNKHILGLELGPVLVNWEAKLSHTRIITLLSIPFLLLEI